MKRLAIRNNGVSQQRCCGRDNGNQEAAATDARSISGPRNHAGTKSEDQADRADEHQRLMDHQNTDVQAG